MINTLQQLERPDVAVTQEITATQAWYFRIVPYRADDLCISFYTDRSEIEVDELALIFDREVNVKQIDGDLFHQLLVTSYRNHAPDRAVETFRISDEDFLDNLILDAHAYKSSDIHLERLRDRALIRFRVDGRLVERYKVDVDRYPEMVNQVKIKAHLDIAEKRLPQDGRIPFSKRGVSFDLRISSLPTLHGEKLVIRLLSRNDEAVDLEKLGFTELQQTAFLNAIKQPNGLVLISGPTGSGKTTTLYAALQKLNRSDRNILTIEDPVEYTLAGINQVQLKESIGLTYPNALRTFLRQDPDIIMVGEIRDKQTASMALRASLTGHLVLSTLHTNSAWGIVTRLTDLGIEPFLIAETLNAAIAQRLVRLLCAHCKTTENVSDRRVNGTFSTFKPDGCERCHYTGYSGRTAIYEVISIDEHLTEAIRSKRADASHIIREMKTDSLADRAFRLYESGDTSYDEVSPYFHIQKK